jgi:hypothetical protein
MSGKIAAGERILENQQQEFEFHPLILPDDKIHAGGEEG